MHNKTLCKMRACAKKTIAFALTIATAAALLPATIISKDLISSTVVKNCYEKSVSLFPHLVPLVSYINKGGTF